MTGYPRKSGLHGHLYLTRESDSWCQAVEQCGLQCQVEKGGHEGEHLFEAHRHVGPQTDVRWLAEKLHDTNLGFRNCKEDVRGHEACLNAARQIIKVMS